MEGKMIRAIHIENEIELKATPEAVFEAMTTKQLDWYPYNYGGERLRAIVFETHVGGRCYEDWGDGHGILYGTVAYYDYPKAVCLRGHLKGGVTLESWLYVEPHPDGAVLKQSMVCFGEISDEDATGIRTHGDIQATLPQLKAYLENS